MMKNEILRVVLISVVILTMAFSVSAKGSGGGIPNRIRPLARG